MGIVMPRSALYLNIMNLSCDMFMDKSFHQGSDMRTANEKDSPGGTMEMGW